MILPARSAARGTQGGRALLLLILLCLPACGASAVAPARTYYVDFENGSDQASGVSASQPWKHAPGDLQAGGGPARTTLQAGDAVLFRAGVVYRGTIQLAATGAEGQPISYRGKGFGDGRAVLSGRDAFRVKVQPCSASPMCAALPDAAQLRVVDLPGPMAPSDQLVLDGHLLKLAQGPELPDSFWYDDLAHYQAISGSAVTQEGGLWKLKSSFLRKALGDAPVGDLVVHLWGQPNAVTSAPSQGYDPIAGELTVNATAFKPYKDRDSKFALVNHPALIRRDYEFATIDHGAQIVVRAPLAPGEATIEISKRGTAFSLHGPSHISIEGFDIQGYSGGPREWGAGSAMTNGSKPASDITFRDNLVHDLTSWAGAGAIHVTAISGLRIIDNSFERLSRGAGVIINAKSSDIRILRNRFDHIGRTGIAVFGAERVWISQNQLSELRAAHGNGISIYLENKDVLISNNTIQGAERGITFHGSDKTPGAAANLTIRHNLLVSFGENGSAIQSWSGSGGEAGVMGVTIEGNVIEVADGRFALRLAAADQKLIVRHNIVDGLTVGGSPPGDWMLEGNAFTRQNYVPSATADDAYTRANTSAPNWESIAAKPLKRGDVFPPKVCLFLMSQTSANADIAWLEPSERAEPVAGIGPDGLCAP